jgi:hypothetical protein
MQQNITLTSRIHLPFEAQPVRHGMPWPQGAVQPGTPITAQDEKGAAVPIGTRTLNLWPDGSVQWTLVDLAVDFEPSGTRVITVKAGETPSIPNIKNPVVVTTGADSMTVSNGLVTLTASRGASDSLVQDWVAGEIDAIITDKSGEVFSAARCDRKSVRIEDANPLCTVLRIEGKHQSTDEKSGAPKTLLEFWVRFTVTANRPDVKITYHYHNLEEDEPGVFLKTMELKLQTRMAKDASRAIVHGFRGRATRIEPYRLPEDFEICSSNTMDLETYPQTHKGITGGGMGKVFIRQMEFLRDDPMLKPWFLRNVVNFKFETKDAPEASTWSYLGLVETEKSLLVAGANMVGLHPKSLQVVGNLVRYWVWPDWAGVMDITQGEGRTLDLWVSPMPGDVSDMELMRRYLSWEFSGVYGHWPVQNTIQSSLDIAHVRACKVFYSHLLPEFDPRTNFAFERKVQAQWTPDGPAPAGGHIQYGDVFARWDIGVNNEEMVGHTWFMEYLRTGRSQCLEKGIAQSQHIIDVDICAKSADKFQEGGMCSHGPRHNHTSAYPSHMWFTELLFAYAFTGDEEYKKAAVRVSDNLVRWTTEPWGFENLCADGRESGQPLINLTWVYRFVPDPKYLQAINKIVRVSFMERVKKHGSLVYMKPREDLALLKYQSYGEWAAWEGLFYAWDLTKDEEIKNFILSQLEWRLTEDLMGTSGSFRSTDFNVAAYAYLMTGDASWLQRVKRPFKAVFRGVQWPFGYIKTMYFIKLAFEKGLITDDEVLLS